MSNNVDYERQLRALARWIEEAPAGAEVIDLVDNSPESGELLEPTWAKIQAGDLLSDGYVVGPPRGQPRRASTRH